jgi:hypothetical protein
MDTLDKIALEAGGIEADAQAAEDAILNPNPEPVIDPASAWAQLPMMFGGILAMAMPELKDVYTEPACMQWGGAMAQVAEKRGWDAQETMAKWGPEIALVLASVPLVVPTVAAIKKKRAEGAQNKRIEQEQAQQDSGIDMGATIDAPTGEGLIEPS